MKQRAFTLAEVLITLSIIGVVAALTIPSLMVNNQKKETLVKLQKFYTTFSNAMELAKIDHGSVENWEFPADNDGIENFIKTYISKYLNGQIDRHTMTLADGTLLSFERQVAYIKIFVALDGKYKKGVYGKNVFGFAIAKKNNDYYVKNITEGFGPIGMGLDNETIKISTYGCRVNAYDCCAAFIMNDGWQIKDDYPW